MKSTFIHRTILIVVVLLTILLTNHSYRPANGESSATENIGFRTEAPGPFLTWPLQHVAVTEISRLPDSPWTHQFLGITDCPPYPALIDSGHWPYGEFRGNYDGNRALILPGIPDERVKWQNRDASNAFNNVFACYGARSGLPDHAGTDISAWNGTDVLAAAPADQIEVTYNANNGQYRVRLRHPNVNGSGQTWYTYYVHLQSAAYSAGTRAVTIPVGQKIGTVGQGHLHFQVAVGPGYSHAETRNPWGIDQSPWTGCLWLDQTICPMATETAVEEKTVQPTTSHFKDVPTSDLRLRHIETLYHIGAVNGFSDGTFRPSDATARSQAAKMVILALGRTPHYTDGAAAFSDVPATHTFYQFIRDLKELQITGGFSDGTYRPDESLNRCGAAKFVVLARGDNPNYTDGRAAFTDVPANHACYQYIRHLKELGISNGYSDGTFRPDNPIARGDMAVFVVRGLPQVAQQLPAFHDVLHDHPFYAHVQAIFQRKLTNGCSSNSPYPIFCPGDPLKREQAAAFISRALGFTVAYNDGRQSFPDVPTNHPFYQAIEHVRDLGVVHGYSDGSFRPGEMINRRQFAQMIVRGLQVLHVSCPTQHTDAFPDVPPTVEAYTEIQCLKDLGISTGYSNGNYQPAENLTRGAAAKLLNLAFINRTSTIAQEPEETINDTFASAPVLEVMAPVDNNSEESAATGEAINLIIPSSPTDDDKDIVALDVVAGTQYEAEATEIGANVDAELEMIVLSQVTGANTASPAQFDITVLANATLPFRWTATQTGRYYLRFDNAKSFATDGVNLRVGIREVATQPLPTDTPIPPTPIPTPTPTATATQEPISDHGVFLPLVQR